MYLQNVRVKNENIFTVFKVKSKISCIQSDDE